MEPFDLDLMGSAHSPDQDVIRSRSVAGSGAALLHLGMSLMSALLFALTQSPIGIGVLAVVALVPWIAASRRAGALEALWLGVFFGVAHAVMIVNWLPAAFEGQGVYGVRSFIATILTAFWGKGLLFGVAGGVAQRLRNRGVLVQAAGLGAVLGLGELWISESRWGLPLILLGHSQITVSGVAQLAVIVGVPGISALLMATNSAIASLFEKRPQSGSIAAAFLAAWGITATFGLPLAVALRPSTASETKTLLVVQPAIPRAHRWEPAFQNFILDEIATYTTEALEIVLAKPDLILWPENLLTTPPSSNRRLKQHLQDYVDLWDVPVVTGLVRNPETNTSGQYRNSAVWWSPRTGLRDAVDKVRAIPLLESSRDFIGRSALAFVAGEASQGTRVVEAREARPLVGAFSLATALCFEVLFPRIVEQRRDEKSVAIVNLADDSWVPGEVADAQLIAAASFRAIEQRLTLIRVSHGGLSVVVDPFGRERASLPADVYADMNVEVSAQAPVSLAEMILILALPISAGLIAWSGAILMVRARARDGGEGRPSKVGLGG